MCPANRRTEWALGTAVKMLMMIVIVVIVVLTNGCVRLDVVYGRGIILRSVTEGTRPFELKHFQANFISACYPQTRSFCLLWLLLTSLSSRQPFVIGGLCCRNGLWQYICDTHSESIKHNTYTAEGRLTGNNKGKLGFVLREWDRVRISFRRNLPGTTYSVVPRIHASLI